MIGGENNGFAIRPDGSVLSWGSNGFGLLGNGTTCSNQTGANCVSDVPVPVSGLTGITDVHGGNLTSYAVRADGTVWGWGSAERGALGPGQECESEPCVRTAPVKLAGLAGVSAIGDATAVR